MAKTELTLPQRDRVYQRGANGMATIRFSASRPVRVRVVKGARTVVGWRRSRSAIAGVPTGGPYTLEFELPEGMVRKVGGVLVGDLWVLAGQSNMDGIGKLVDLEPPSPMVHAYYYDETWDVAKDPLCRVYDSVDSVHWPVPKRDLAEHRDYAHNFAEAGAGLGVRFGKDLYKATRVPIGLIVCSHGGTSMDQWDPKKARLGGRSLYGSMLRRVGVCGGKVAGVVWYQGESDAHSDAPGYTSKMKMLVRAMRRDFGDARLPFVYVQLGRYFVSEEEFPPGPWNRVQQEQLALADALPRAAMAAAVDGDLSDIIHLDAPALRVMGSRLAELALVLKYGKKAPLTLQPARVACSDKARTAIRVRYKNVRGRLRPGTKVWGFWVEDATGRIPLKRVSTKGDTVTLELARPAKRGAKVWYGRGLNPTVNLRDAKFAAPVYGPVGV
jgi:sialate O-acetylesterase